MFFSMMLTLAVASSIVEGAFAAKVKIWRVNAHKFKWVNMVISIGLSYILGIAFGAEGLITMGAAMLSTVLSIPMYAFLNWNYDTPTAVLHGGNECAYYYDKFKVKLEQYKLGFNKWRVAMADFGKLIYTIIRTITFPIWMARDLMRWLRPRIQRFNDWTESKRAAKAAKLRTTP